MLEAMKALWAVGWVLALLFGAGLLGLLGIVAVAEIETEDQKPQWD